METEFGGEEKPASLQFEDEVYNGGHIDQRKVPRVAPVERHGRNPRHSTQPPPLPPIPSLPPVSRPNTVTDPVHDIIDPVYAVISFMTFTFRHSKYQSYGDTWSNRKAPCGDQRAMIVFSSLD